MVDELVYLKLMGCRATPMLCSTGFRRSNYRNSEKGPEA